MRRGAGCTLAQRALCVGEPQRRIASRWQARHGRAAVEEVSTSAKLGGTSAPEAATRPGKLIVAPGCGTASTFGNLSGMSRTEADAFLRSLYPARVDTTRSGAYTEYRFADGSKVWIEQATGRFGASAARAELLPHHLTDRTIAGMRVQTNATNNDDLIGEDMPLAVDI